MTTRRVNDDSIDSLTEQVNVLRRQLKQYHNRKVVTLPLRSAATLPTDAGTGDLVVAEDENLYVYVNAAWVPVGSGGPRAIAPVWVGPYPQTGWLVVLMVPFVDGATVEFTITRLVVRMEVAGTATTTARFQKSAGGNSAFSASTIGDVSLASGDFQDENTSPTITTLESGDLIRLTWTAIANDASGYMAMLEAIESG
jgi:hypothetical protein